MTIDDVWQQICQRPDDEAPRLQFADLIEPSDPIWATYIRRAIKISNDVRQGIWADSRNPQPRPEQIASWARNVLKFVAYGRTENVIFHRGFPEQLTLQPATFAEYGELLSRLAPIRHVDFCDPYDEDEKVQLDEKGKVVVFPLDELLACPHLEKLESCGFMGANLEHTAGEKISRCPTLKRCLYLEFGGWQYVPDRSIIALAEGPLTSKMIAIRCDLKAFSEYSIMEEGPRTSTIYRYEFAQAGKDLEQRLGYIPWLHIQNSSCGRLDMRWYVENGRVPKVKAGTKPPQDDWYEVSPTWESHGDRW